MSWPARMLVIAFGLLTAIAAGTITLALTALFDPVMALFTAESLWIGLWSLFEAVESAEDPALVLETTGAGFVRLAGAILIAPPVLTALVGEVLGWQRLLWYAGGTGLLTAALPWLMRPSAEAATPEELHIAVLLGLSGAVAGLVYWLVAGQSAGVGRGRPAAHAGLAAERHQG